MCLPTAAATLSDPTGSDIDYQQSILTQVNIMDDILAYMTTQLKAVPEPTPPPPTGAGPEEETEDEPDVQDPLELLPHGRVLSKRFAQLPLLPRRLTIQAAPSPDAPLPAAPLSADPLKPCDGTVVHEALVNSVTVLDKVSDYDSPPDILKEMMDQNVILRGFLTGCSLSGMSYEHAQALLGTVTIVETHVVAARAAVTPPEVGLEVSSGFMVVVITLSCLMALLSLVGLAVLAFRYTTTSSASSGATKSDVGGRKDVKTGRPGRDAAYTNPAFQPADPPGSLHQARNDRWRPHDAVQPESPHRPPANSKSTWGRIWGGVVRDYKQSRDSVAEPTHQHSPPPRRASPPPRRYSPPPRRYSPPPRRASPPPRRASPPPRRASPPPRRASPPPRRYSPPPQQEGGDNWAYGPTGRNKSTDSPFASAW